MEKTRLNFPHLPERQVNWRAVLILVLAALALASAAVLALQDGGDRQQPAAPAFADGLAAAHALAGEFFVLDTAVQPR
jgi:hypothetical protein